ncbi:hypothetical protein [Carnobacterium pleistocenium]|uniref:hypothetical protein n=1 Tax=Carnobacterium pleistocenium TaxID=181073 RepID=UPI0005551EBE|nr:hypothetical protein [Carnobacterium pleistocenium]
MAHFFSSYWWMFSGIFIMASILITLNLIKVISFKKDLSFNLKLVDLVISLGILFLLVSANLFSGVLYDQFNLATDNLLLILTFYSGILFLIQIFYTFKKTKKVIIHY